MSGISVDRRADRVTITTEVGGKTARISVTHERAKELACQMLGLEDSPMRGVIDGALRVAEQQRGNTTSGQDFLDRLRGMVGR
jgi:hypothetical protein